LKKDDEETPSAAERNHLQTEKAKKSRRTTKSVNFSIDSGSINESNSRISAV